MCNLLLTPLGWPSTLNYISLSGYVFPLSGLISFWNACSVWMGYLAIHSIKVRGKTLVEFGAKKRKVSSVWRKVESVLISVWKSESSEALWGCTCHLGVAQIHFLYATVMAYRSTRGTHAPVLASSQTLLPFISHQKHQAVCDCSSPSHPRGKWRYCGCCCPSGRLPAGHERCRLCSAGKLHLWYGFSSLLWALWPKEGEKEGHLRVSMLFYLLLHSDLQISRY